MCDYYLSSLYRQNSNVNYLNSLYGQNNNAFYLGGLYCQNNVLGMQDYPNFQSVFAASIKGQDFQELLTTRFPGVKYHVMDTSRIDAVLVPPKLEAKLEEDPSLAQELMNKISALMMQQDTVASTIDSFNIAFDEDGNISNYRFSGGGGRVMWQSEEEQQKSRALEAEKMRRQARIHHL